MTAGAGTPFAAPGPEPFPVVVRLEVPGDELAVRGVNRAAFPGPEEAAITDAVRQGNIPEARLAEAAQRASRLRAAPSTVANGASASRASEAAARRAVRVEGVTALSPGTGWVIATCRDAPGIAVGDVPWGVADGVVARDPTSCAIDVSPADAVGDLLTMAGGRPLAVVARDAHRHTWQRELAERLAAARPGVVVVEMGWHGSSTAPVRIVAHGAAPPNARAVADLLVGRAGG